MLSDGVAVEGLFDILSWFDFIALFIRAFHYTYLYIHSHFLVFLIQAFSIIHKV